MENNDTLNIEEIIPTDSNSYEDQDEEFLLISSAPPLDKPISMGIAKGTYLCTDYTFLHDTMFPKFSYSRKCKLIKVYVVDTKMNYHLIIGWKYMKQIALKMDFETSTITWFDKTMSFHPQLYFHDNWLLQKIVSNEPYSIAESYIAQSKQSYVDSATKYGDTNLKDLILCYTSKLTIWIYTTYIRYI